MLPSRTDARPRIADARSPASAFRRGLALVVLVCLCGFAVGLAMLQVDDGAWRNAGNAMTAALYRNQDTYWFAFCVVCVLYIRWSLGRSAAARTVSLISRFWPEDPRPLLAASKIAIVVLIFVGGGTYLVHHGFSFVVDEYLAEFQAAIFREGELLASHPPEWTEYGRALHHSFTYLAPSHDLWGSGYRPVFAALRALFSLASLGALTNTFLTAMSVVLVAAIARKLWPDRRDAAVLAAVLLATSPQFLFTGMTGFAWPAHLCLNLLWLWLYLRDDTAGHVLAALVGVAAAGLHQIQAHAFFVLPFMLALLQDKRWRLAAWYGGVYAAGHLTWIFWQDIALLLTAEPGTADPGRSRGVGYVTDSLALFAILKPLTVPLMGLNLLRMLAWVNLALVPLIVVALRPWSAAPPVVRLLALGFVFSLIPYVLVMPNQMYGLGYRYFHGLLGNMALLAAYGWIKLSKAESRELFSAKRVIAGLTVITLAVGVPLRALQVEGLVGPIAAATRYVASRPADAVLVDYTAVWIGPSLVRNDPYLRNRPLVFALNRMTPEQILDVCGRFSVEVVDYYDVAAFGVRSIPTRLSGLYDIQRQTDIRRLRALATSPDCNNRP
ncbi:MAG: hypothetical protein V3R98_08590 [Alphaproteobacteria bacterium]